MKKLTLLGHVFELETRAYQYLDAYIARIDRYAQEHNTDDELVNDIKYNVIEKLYALTSPVTEASVMNIAQELGEPEQIFETEESVTDTKSLQGFWNNNALTRWLATPKPLLGGVSYWIASALKVPVGLIRLIFLVLVLVYGTGVWGYIILALFVPYKDKSSTIGKSGNLFFEIVRITLWLGILSLLGIVLVGGVVGTMFFSLLPTISNQSIQMLLPIYTYPVITLVLASLGVLFVGALGALLRKVRSIRLLSFISIGVIVVGVAVLARIPIGYFFAYQLTGASTNTDTLFSGTAESDSLHISILSDRTNQDKLYNYGSRHGMLRYFYDVRSSIRFKTSDTDTISVQVQNQFRNISKRTDEKINQHFSTVETTLSGSDLTLIIPDNIFDQEVPFVVGRRIITISLPRDKTVVYDNTSKSSLSDDFQGWVNPLSDTQREVISCVPESPLRYYPEFNDWRCSETTSRIEQDDDNVESDRDDRFEGDDVFDLD